jgi:hypothetical protein
MLDRFLLVVNRTRLGLCIFLDVMKSGSSLLGAGITNPDIPSTSIPGTSYSSAVDYPA